MTCRSLLRFPAAALLAALSLSVAACAPGDGSPAAPPVDGAATGALGVIAYINTGGCIERVSAASAEPTGQPYCAESRAGVTSLTWIDADSVAYATNEARAMGWQLVHFSTRASETMPIADAPRVLLIPPQYYSSKGERLAIDENGVVSRADAEGDVRIFPPEGNQPDDSTRLVAWSPDGEWIVLSTSVEKELWVVSRTGESPHRIAESSKGVAAWFMPEVGATPHADLTCSVTTSQSFGCVVPLRLPMEKMTVNAAAGGTVDFSWSACPGATGYLFEIYGPGGSAPIVSTIVVGTFSHQAVSGLPAGELRWRVRALIGSSPAPWSEERVLTVLPAPKT